MAKENTDQADQKTIHYCSKYILKRELYTFLLYIHNYTQQQTFAIQQFLICDSEKFIIKLRLEKSVTYKNFD